MLNAEDQELIGEFQQIADGTLTRFDGKLNEFKSEMKREMRQNAARPPGAMLPAGGVRESESVGALVAKDSRFQTLQAAGRGIAQVGVNRRLIETKAAVVMGAALMPGTQTSPIAPLPGPALTVADFIPQRPMTEGSLQFVRQLSPRVVAGLQVAQGDVKTEGTLVTEMVELSPATLAVWIPASRQALRDVGGLQLLIDSELLYAIRTLEEAEILNGVGAGHLTGILPLAPAQAPTAGDTGLDSIARAIGALTASGIQATGIVLHPNDWLAVMLSKDLQDSYLLASPAAATAQTVWGVPLALTSAIPAGTGLVGNFTLGAELAYREQAVVDVSTEHADFFIRNLICIRAEESLALAVKQPPAFLKFTLGTGALAARNGGQAAKK